MSRQILSNNMKLGKLIRSKRKEVNKTLHQIATLANIDATTLSKIERGERLPTEEQLTALSVSLNISIVELKSLFIADRIIREYGPDETTIKGIMIVKDELEKYNKK